MFLKYRWLSQLELKTTQSSSFLKNISCPTTHDLFLSARLIHHSSAIPFTHPSLASLYYSINNQLRLILFLQSSFYDSIRMEASSSEMDHTSRVNGERLEAYSCRACWLQECYFWKLLLSSTSSPAIECRWSEKSLKSNWKRLLCDDGNNNNQTAHHRRGDDILNWQFNLLMIHGSISLPARMLELWCQMKRDGSIDRSERDTKNGSFHQHVLI